MSPLQAVRQCGWLVSKDLLREYRVPRVWPAMFLFGGVLVALLDLQMDMPRVWKLRGLSGLLWMAIFFAGTLVLDRSFQGEREDGCWNVLRLYPLPLSLLYVAKLLANFLALTVLELFLLPSFAALSDVDLIAHPGSLAAVLVLTNLGFAALGTLLGALTQELRQRTSLLAVLLFPLLAPLILAAAEATRLLILGDVGPDWWRWMQFIGCFSLLFTTLGIVAFPLLVEE